MKNEALKNSRNFDEIYTQEEAVWPIIKHIPREKIIWECTDFGQSKITKVLKEQGFNVYPSHINDGMDYLHDEPDKWDICITNPPYSKKTAFLMRAFQLKKPFLFLVPLTTLEGKARHNLFKKHDVSVIIPNKRFEFDYAGKENKNGNWFATIWLGNLINGNKIIFDDVRNPKQTSFNF